MFEFPSFMIMGRLVNEKGLYAYKAAPLKKLGLAEWEFFLRVVCTLAVGMKYEFFNVFFYLLHSGYILLWVVSISS